MRRRAFITLLGGAAAWPLAAQAQQQRLRRLGVLRALDESDPEVKSWLAAFQEALQRLGWEQGRNIEIEYRSALGDEQRLRTYAAELVGMAPDVLFAAATPALVALNQETRSLPIVFVQVSDPIGQGFVSSLARPGGNITGFTNFEFSISGKWLETLKTIAPQVTRAAFMFNPKTAPYAAAFLQQAEATGPAFAIRSIAAPAHDAADIERTVEALAGGSNGLVVLPDVLNTTHRELIIMLAARHRLPAIYPFRFFAMSGGLISYGVDIAGQWRRAASYTDRILTGARPGDLPIQQPVKYELVINLKTAKALGLEVPPTLLARVDEVVE